MGQVAPLPSNGEVFFDVRDEGRSMRLSWHPELGGFVMSIWRNGYCVASFQMDPREVPRLVASFVASLAR
jgi:hypothetical protein